MACPVQKFHTAQTGSWHSSAQKRRQRSTPVVKFNICSETASAAQVTNDSCYGVFHYKTVIQVHFTSSIFVTAVVVRGYQALKFLQSLSRT